MEIKRDAERGIIAGVCAGLARHFSIPTWKIRAVFIVLTLLGSFGIILYLVLWFVLPKGGNIIDV